MNIACPECSTVYRLDPARIPETGVRTRCRECEAVLKVAVPAGAEAPGRVTTADRDEPVRTEAVETQPGGSQTAGTQPQATGAPAFGPQDPETRARRLARALVSDIKVYNPERWQESRDEGTLRSTFRDEILKSWEEYVEQVGEEMAKRTPYFRDALNEILAEGNRVF